MKSIYLLCSISKQGHHQALERAQVLRQKEIVYVGFMLQVREIHPGMGLRTMYEHFQPEGIGRDAFIALGLREGFRLAVVGNPVRTTLSIKNRRYCNLLGGRRFTDVNQVWSSDLFYFQVGAKHYYVVLIMDVYSRRIVGFSVADNMRAENNLSALRMALTLRGVSDFENKLIHHSDRGAQYISDDYTDLLAEYGILISMCNEVYENAHIERANGTIKNDYLKRWNIPDAKTLFQCVPKAINAYNNRPHKSLPQKMTPIAFEAYIKELSNKERPLLEIYTINNQISVNPLQLEFNFG
jgi:transposase InsO family protein